MKRSKVRTEAGNRKLKSSTALDECREYYDIFSNKEDGVLSGDLCKDCFDEICEKHHSIIIEDEVVY